MRLIKTFLTVPFALIALVGCKDDKSSAVQNIPQVEAVRVAPENVPLNLEYSARTQGSKETTVRARVNGILIKRHYVEGAKVNEGDVLFEIDHEPYRIALEQARAKLTQTKAQLTAAESQWKRIAKLFEERIVSEKSRDEARANLEQLQAAAQLAQAEVDSAQLNLDYTTVTAPIAGVTSMETVSEGSLIAANDSLTTITQLDPIYVIFSASENELFKLGTMVKKGQIVNANNTTEERRILAKVRYNNGDIYPIEGEVDFINPSIDEATGTLKLRATFANPDKRLIPGQFVRLTLDSILRKDAIIVPQEAIMQGAEGAFVYRVNAENMVENVKVETGVQTGDGQWIIDSGLNAGDVVVTNGVMKIRAGISVKANIKGEAQVSAQQ